MKQVIIIIGIFSVVLNIVLTLFVFQHSKKSSMLTSLAPNDYPFLSKRIFVEDQNDILINFTQLRKSLNAYIEQYKLASDQKNTIQFGMYFEYLPTGISIGINEKNPFVAASLLKVPIIMGVYKYIEERKLREDDVLTISENDLDPSFGDLWKRGANATISVEEAIKITLQKSDNTAKAVLYNNVPESTLAEVFNYLDIPSEIDGLTPIVSPKNYSSILRSLYLSSYLSPLYSQKLLELLTQTDFLDKIQAGVPKTIPVAHKIGVHNSTDNTASIYTDCGIIYVPKRPYILCIMMRDTEDQAKIHMKNISEIIYSYVSKANQPD